jgi:hypothetical protein
MEVEARDIRVTRLVNGEHVIYETTKTENWKDPLILSTQRDEDGKAYLVFYLYIMYSDVNEVDPPSSDVCLCTYEPAPEVIEARDRFLNNYRMERESQKNEKGSGKPRWDTSGKITTLH